MPEAGDLFADRYRLERLLARGGMGSVWVARDERLARIVAIKFMDPQFVSSEELVARFKREASAAGALRTRHVVQVHDFGIEDDTPYIVMELLEGEDLGARLSRLRRLSIGEAAGLVAQIARGLRHAHDAGIIHRDLKPPNLMLCREDDAEVVKILDFGVAKRTQPIAGGLGDATTTKELLGSPQYMSPEQTRGRGDIDHRSDLWALGVIAYRMLCGRIPFDSEHMVDLIVRIQSEPHPPPSSIDPALAPADAFFAKALAKDPAHRFGSALELASALAAFAPEGPTRSSILEPTPAPAPLVVALPGASPPQAPVAVPLLAVPPSSGGGTPAPTPAPRSGALPPSVFGVSPPSLVPPGPRRVSLSMAIAVTTVGALLVSLLLVASALRGARDAPPSAVRAATSAPAGATAPPPPAAEEEAPPPPAVAPPREDPADASLPAEGAPSADASAPEGEAPAASASAAAAPRSSSAPRGPAERPGGAPRAPKAPKPGEKKLPLTY